MNLSEFKKKLKGEAVSALKQSLTEETEFNSNALTEAEIEEARQEWEIESFQEEVDFDGELDLEERVIDEETGLETALDFVPMAEGSVTDLEFEIPEELCTEENLEKICELLFAEEVEITEGGSQRAKVVFKRGKGEIIKKKLCGKGFKLKGNRCIPQTGGEKADNRIKGLKLKRAKRAMGAGKKKRAAIRAKITKRRVHSRSRNYSGTIN